MRLAKLVTGMLSSVEQVFVRRDERRAPLKMLAWKARARNALMVLAKAVRLESGLESTCFKSNLAFLQVTPKSTKVLVKTCTCEINQSVNQQFIYPRYRLRAHVLVQNRNVQRL